jgi:DNA invertase Pin-like site-specific DNA recombinase
MRLEKYAKDNGFDNVQFLYDDGYSGTNFNRPAWNEVLKMIENSEVKTLIVKDLSRLGREYLQVGYYTEIYFPQRGVRFIAVNDGVDSLYSETNDFTPMRNYFNELYAKDSSKKVRVVKRAQAERGELLGGRPPYGYRRDEKVRKGIVPDEEAAVVVKRIFCLCAEGKGPNQIARLLTKEQVLNPTNYYYQKHGKSHASLDTTSPYRWSNSTVTGILDNKTYLGTWRGFVPRRCPTRIRSSSAIPNRSRFWSKTSTSR